MFVMAGSLGHVVAVMIAIHIDAVAPEEQTDLHDVDTSMRLAVGSLFSLSSAQKGNQADSNTSSKKKLVSFLCLHCIYYLSCIFVLSFRK
jgi:hypothetical protein